MNQPFRRPRGQAMVEFAMVLPLLILITFGTIEVGLMVQRRLVLTGTAFVAARVAAVHGQTATAGIRKVVETYAVDSGAEWVAHSASRAKVSSTGTHAIRVSLPQRDSGLTGLLVGAMVTSGGPAPRLGEWQAVASVRREFVPGRLGRGAAQTPTDLQVDYRVRLPGLESLKGLGEVVRKLPGGGSGAGLVLAADPTTQATLPNPMDRHGTVSPSKRYVSPENEVKEFQQAGRLADGFDQLDKVIKAFYSAYVVAATVPGSTGADAALAAVAQGFANLDRAVRLEATAARFDKAQKAFLGGKQ